MPQLSPKIVSQLFQQLKKSQSLGEYRTAVIPLLASAKVLDVNRAVFDFFSFPMEDKRGAYPLVHAIHEGVEPKLLAAMILFLSNQSPTWLDDIHLRDALILAFEKKLPLNFFQTISSLLTESLQLSLLRQAIIHEHDAAYVVFFPQIHINHLTPEIYIELIDLALKHNVFPILNTLLSVEQLQGHSLEFKSQMMTLLLHALQSDYAVFVKRLIDSGLLLENRWLHQAVEFEKRSIASYLLKIGANPNECDAQGMTALHYAVQTNQRGLIGILDRYGADLHHLTQAGQSVFQLTQDEHTLKQLLRLITPNPLGNIETINDHPPIQYLAIRGGGVKGLAYPHAIKEAEKQNLFKLSELKGVSGASAGAITAALIALNYNVDELEETICGIKISDYIDPIDTAFKVQEKALQRIMGHFSGGVVSGALWTILSPVDASRVKGLFDTIALNKGMMHGDLFHRWMQARIQEKMQSLDSVSDFLKQHPELVTFSDLKMAGFKDLRIVATDVNRAHLVSFSAESTPDAIVVDAIRASMCFPLVFKPHHYYIRTGTTPANYQREIHPDYQDIDLIDGGIMDNYPVRTFDKDHFGKHQSYNSNVLGLYLATADEKKEFENGMLALATMLKTGKQFFSALISSLLYHQEHIHLESTDSERTVYINTLDIGVIDFEVSPDKLRQLAEEARRSIHDFMSRRSGQQSLSPLSATTLQLLIELGAHQFQKIEPYRTTLSLSRLSFDPEKILTLYANCQENELTRLRALVNPNGTRDLYGNSALHIAFASRAMFEQALASDQISWEEKGVISIRLSQLNRAIDNLRRIQVNEAALNLDSKQPIEMTGNEALMPLSDLFLIGHPHALEKEFLEQFIQLEQKKSQQLVHRYEEKTQQFDALRQELAAIIPDKQILTRDIARLDQAHLELFEQHDRLISENATLSDEVAIETRHYAQLIEEKRKLTTAQARLNEEHQRTLASVEEMNGQNEALKNNIALLMNTQKQLTGQLDVETRFNEQRQQFRLQLQEANAVIGEQASTIHRLEQHVKALRIQIRSQKEGEFRESIDALIQHRSCLILESRRFFAIHRQRKKAKIEAIDSFVETVLHSEDHRGDASLTHIETASDRHHLLRAGLFSRTAVLMDRVIHAESKVFSLGGV